MDEGPAASSPASLRVVVVTFWEDGGRRSWIFSPRFLHIRDKVTSQTAEGRTAKSNHTFQEDLIFIDGTQRLIKSIT